MPRPFAIHLAILFPLRLFFSCKGFQIGRDPVSINAGKMACLKGLDQVALIVTNGAILLKNGVGHINQACAIMRIGNVCPDRIQRHRVIDLIVQIRPIGITQTLMGIDDVVERFFFVRMKLMVRPCERNQATIKRQLAGFLVFDNGFRYGPTPDFLIGN